MNDSVQIQASPIPGVSLLLEGPIGSGKTEAIKQWVAEGIEVFCILTEPNYQNLQSIPAEKLHWKYIAPASTSWADMKDSATKINSFDIKTLSNMGDVNKTKYQQFMQLITQCNNFHCDRTNKDYGDVANWNTDRVLVLDSLSGVNIMAMNLVVGSKPMKSMADWGMAMDNLERFLQKLCMDKKCHLQMNAHVEREMDEVTGQSFVMTATLGRKLAPKIPRFFTDVVLTKKEQEKFYWATMNYGTDLAARNLPLADKIPAETGVKTLLTNWKKAGGILVPTV